MANDVKVHSLIANEALWLLQNELVMADLVYRGYEQEWRTINGHKIGDTLTIPVPPRFQTVQGPDITGKIQDIVEGATTITINKQATVPVKFDVRSISTLQDIKRLGENVLKDAMGKIAQDIENDLGALAKTVANFSGTAGSTITTTAALGTAAANMTKLGVPMTNRRAVIDPDANMNLAEQLKTLYIDSKNKSALEESRLGKIHKFETYQSASLYTHVAGNWVGTPLINGANQKVAYTAVKDTWYQDIAMDGLTGTPTVKAGDVINIAGVFEVNSSTRTSTGRLRDFVVVNDATAAAGVIAALRISPPIIPVDSLSTLDQANATVNTTPADNAAITVKTGASGTVSRQSLAFQRNAFVLCMPPLKKLDSFPVWETRTKNNISITLSKGFDINTHSETWRFDAIYGVKTIQMELAQRIAGGG